MHNEGMLMRHLLCCLNDHRSFDKLNDFKTASSILEKSNIDYRPNNFNL